MGHHTSASLKIDDLFDIGKLAIKYGEPYLAIEWMREITLLKSKTDKDVELIMNKVTLLIIMYTTRFFLNITHGIQDVLFPIMLGFKIYRLDKNYFQR